MSKEYKEKLDELIKNKKKDVSKAESAQYQENLSRMLQMEAICEKTVKYIMDGYVFGSSDVVAKYIQKLESKEMKNKSIKALLDSSDYKNSINKLSIAVALLSEFILCGENSKEIFQCLIISIVANKNNTLKNVLNKNFIVKLKNLDKELPVLDELELPGEDSSKFKADVKEALRKAKEEKKANIRDDLFRKLCTWIGGVPEAADAKAAAENNTMVSKSQEITKAEVKEQGTTIPEKAPSTSSLESKEEPKQVDTAAKNIAPKEDDGSKEKDGTKTLDITDNIQNTENNPLGSLAQNILNAGSKIQELEQEKDKLAAALKSMENKYRKEVQKNSALEADCNKLKDTINNQNSLLNKSLDKAGKLLNNNILASEKFSDRLESLMREFAVAVNDKKRLEKDLAGKEAELKGSSEQCEALETENSDLKQQIAELKSQNVDLGIKAEQFKNNIAKDLCSWYGDYEDAKKYDLAASDAETLRGLLENCIYQMGEIFEILKNKGIDATEE